MQNEGDDTLARLARGDHADFFSSRFAHREWFTIEFSVCVDWKETQDGEIRHWWGGIGTAVGWTGVSMFAALKELDRILRGDATRIPALRSGSLPIPITGVAGVIVLLGCIYGACMGCFALARETGPSFQQWFASTVKMPLLFLLTLVVTFPSLYVFNALVGSRLGLASVLKLLIAAMGVTLAVAASLGPIVAFFSVSTTSYPFMVLFNILVLGVSGVLGLMFLLQTLHRLSEAMRQVLSDAPTDSHPAGDESAATPDPAGDSNADTGPLVLEDGQVLGAHVKTVFRCWIVVFGLVGAQMSWVLRPFIGDPTTPFQWFRARDSNFFEAVGRALSSLFG